MRILLTGSAGFIGRNFTELYSAHYDLFHVDALHSDSADIEFWNSLPDDKKLAQCVGNINEELLELWGITHVIHAAARSHVDDSISNPLAFTLDNVLATHSFLDACREYGKLEKIVLVSTDEVLGSLELDDNPFREDDPYRPNSPYSASKASQEMIARAYHETYGLPIVITRCSNNYGKWQHPSKLIPKILKCFLTQEKIPVYGNGLNIRDWIHVEDHCRGLMQALVNGKSGEIYHFGGNCELTNLKIIETLYLCFGYIGDFKEVINFTEDRLGHDKRYSVNSWKAEKQLGWHRQHKDVTSELDLLINWARTNKEWILSK